MPASIYENYPTENPGQYQNLSAISAYGTTCAAWDQMPGTPWHSSCPNTTANWSTLGSGGKNWCQIPWCYVDSSCPTAVASSVFNGSTAAAYYSYDACGAPDCYNGNSSTPGCPYDPNSEGDYRVDSSSCACIYHGQEFPASLYQMHPTSEPGAYENMSAIKIFGSTCAAWDQMPGTPWAASCPAGSDWCSPQYNWCQNPYCYVSSSCSSGIATSVWGSGVYYSYETCQSTPDCYTNRNGAATRLLPATCPVSGGSGRFYSAANCSGSWTSGTANWTTRGTDTACRLNSSTVSSPCGDPCPHYDVILVDDLDTCAAVCDARMDCMAVEQRGRRCEIWTVAADAFSTGVSGAECAVYSGPAKTANMPIGVTFDLMVSNLNLTAASMIDQAALVGITLGAVAQVAAAANSSGLMPTDVSALLMPGGLGKVSVYIQPNASVNPLLIGGMFRSDAFSDRVHLPDAFTPMKDGFLMVLNSVSSILANFTTGAYDLTATEPAFVINPSSTWGMMPTPAPTPSPTPAPPGSPTPAPTPNIADASGAPRAGPRGLWPLAASPLLAPLLARG